MKYGIIKNQICIFSGSLSQCLYAVGMQISADWKSVTVEEACVAGYRIIKA